VVLVPNDHDGVALFNGGDADAAALDQAKHALGELLSQNLPKNVFNILVVS